jgi:hypothetical protein
MSDIPFAGARGKRHSNALDPDRRVAIVGRRKCVSQRLAGLRFVRDQTTARRAQNVRVTEHHLGRRIGMHDPTGRVDQDQSPTQHCFRPAHSVVGEAPHVERHL